MQRREREREENRIKESEFCNGSREREREVREGKQNTSWKNASYAADGIQGRRKERERTKKKVVISP